MSSSDKLNSIVLVGPRKFDYWLVAIAQLSHEEAVCVLGDPHFTESDPRRTADGEEDHWAFEFDCGLLVGIILRRPYFDSKSRADASIYADPPETENALKCLSALLAGRDVCIADPPMLML